MSLLAGLWFFWMTLSWAGLVEAVLSLGDGKRWARELEDARNRVLQGSQPPLTLILPCAGQDPGLEQNLTAYCNLDYPDYQLVIVTSDRNDASVPTLMRVLREHPETAAELVFAGFAQDRGQKVHNLLAAIHRVRPRDLVLVFGDSDIRPHLDWLLSLVAPLREPGVGATSGFRWYLPQGRGWPSRIRSAWNSGIAGLMRVENSPFAWGGAMAVTRENFFRCGVPEAWERSLSDDLSLTAALRGRGLRIRFCPRALSFSHEDCTLRDFWSWSFRQLAITRVYSPGMWRLAWIAQTLNSIAVWGGAGLMLAGFWNFLSPLKTVLTTLLAGSIFLLGVGKATQRQRAVVDLFPEHCQALQRYRWSYRLLGPVASLFTLAALFRSVFSRVIEWRGIRYRMVSTSRTEVLSRNPGQ